MMKWFGFVVLLAYSQRLTAQSLLRLQHLNVEQGLSQSSVYNILQDSRGFMWFATGDGLNRYDGKDFVVFKSKINDTSSSGFIERNINSAIFEDNNNRLWMCADGIFYFDCIHSKYKMAVDTYSLLFALDSSALWSCTARRGIYKLDLNSLQFTNYPLTDKWHADTAHYCMIHNGAASKNTLWVADQAGILKFDKKTNVYTRIFESDKIKWVQLLKNGQLLWCAEGGIYLYDTGLRVTTFIPIKKGADKPYIWTSAVEDTVTQTVYLAAQNEGTICKYNLATHETEFIDFQTNMIYCLYIDRSQNLWVGTEGSGIYKLDLKIPNFSCYSSPLSSRPGGETGLMIKSIYHDDAGKIWMGSFYNGLILYDPKLKKVEEVTTSIVARNKLIGAIMKDSLGEMVVAVGTRILWVDAKTKAELGSINLNDKTSSTAQEGETYAIAEWKKSHFIIATNIGLYSLKYENGIAKVLHYFNSENDLCSWSYGILKRKDGELYIGKRGNGYLKVRMINDSSYKILDKGFDHMTIRNFYECGRYTILWMASEKGLIAYNKTTKKYKIFDETSGLANSCIYAILAQNDSSLWVSTNRGLANIKVGYRDVNDITADIKNYGTKDGLQSNEFNTGAYYKGEDGIFYFGGIAGINWFDPNKIKANPYKALPAITQIFIEDKLYAGDTAAYIRGLYLPFNKNTISLSLAALEFTHAEQNKFAYKLQGLDKEWVYTSNDKVRYSNLPPGEYEFVLKVSNDDGIWNDEPLKLKVIVYPPFWQTWWFRVIMLAMIISGIILITRRYTRQKVRMKTRELEQQQALYIERLRISKDVHDDLGSGLSKISLMAEVAQKKAVDNVGLGNDIRHISTVSKELADNMRDLIWVLNPDNTTLEQLVARIREYCIDYLENIPIVVCLDFPDNVPALPISREAQRNIFLTMKEAINNSVKHAAATEIKIGLWLDADIMKVVIADNGKGFDKERLKRGGNGLRNMKQRIELTGGTFTINTSAFAGTTTELVIPLSKLVR
jgi:signal transduction histidine kinase/ligand-binding sensor domain-containing protein